MIDKLSFGINVGKAAQELDKKLQQQEARQLKKQFEATSGEIVKQFDKLKKELTPDDFNLLKKRVEMEKKFHLYGNNIHKSAEAAGQTREAMAEHLAAQSVLENYQEIIKNSKRENF